MYLIGILLLLIVALLIWYSSYSYPSCQEDTNKIESSLYNSKDSRWDENYNPRTDEQKDSILTKKVILAGKPSDVSHENAINSRWFGDVELVYDPIYAVTEYDEIKKPSELIGTSSWVSRKWVGQNGCNGAGYDQLVKSEYGINSNVSNYHTPGNCRCGCKRDGTLY